jgi:hypothetical protein
MQNQTPNPHAGYPQTSAAYVPAPQWLKEALQTMALPTISPDGMAKVEPSFRKENGAYSVVLHCTMQQYSDRCKLSAATYSQLVSGKKYGDKYGYTAVFWQQ